jgi:hypothetical protein
LKGEAAHKDEFVHVLDLYDYVNRKVKSEHVDQEPVLHVKDVDNNFPIALSRISTTMKTLSKQMKDWFEALKYEFELHELHGDNYFEWIIKVPIGRRRYKYVLVRGIEGQIGLKDVNTLRQAIDYQDVDEGWLVTTRQVSQIARDAVKDSNLFW